MMFLITFLIIVESFKTKQYTFIVPGLLTALYSALYSPYSVLLTVLAPDPDAMRVDSIIERILIIVIAVILCILLSKGIINKCCAIFAVLAAVVRWCWFLVFYVFQYYARTPGIDAYRLFNQAAAVYNGFQIAVAILLLTTQILLWLNLRKYRHNSSI